MSKKELIKAYLAWGAVCIFWGTTYLAIRIGVEVFPAAIFAGIRFLIAGVLFLVFLLIRGYKLPVGRELLDITIVGIALLTIANGIVVWAEQWVPSGLAALIVATLPFWMVGIEATLPRGDKLNFKKVLGIVTGFAGLVLLVYPDLRGSTEPGYLTGMAVILIAPLSWGAGSIYSKYRTMKTKPLMAAALQMVIAGVLLTLLGTMNGELAEYSYTFKGLAALAYLVVFGSLIGYSSYIYALDKLPASIVSMYAYINPLIAVILGWLILDEKLDWSVATATIIIISGLLMVKVSRQPEVIKKPSLMQEVCVENKKAVQNA
ncbi:MAG: EamA family transporter [bacterium]